MTTTAIAHYLAAGASASWPMTVFATQDGIAANGESVVWNSSTGASVSGAQKTDANGAATAVVAVSAIASGATDGVGACVWTSVCAGMQIWGVPQSLWAIAVANGAGQSVHVGTALLPVTMLLTDGAGHPLERATVQVYQDDEAWQAACPTHGACPAAPVIAKSSTTLISDGNGNIIMTPLITGSVPQVVNIAASTGTNGFVTMTLNVMP